MKRQREDTYLSQAIVAAQSAAAYDTNENSCWWTSRFWRES